MFLKFMIPLVILLALLPSCKNRTPPESKTLDAGFVTTPTENQRASAFCWAYSIVAHLEQRFYEQTRGTTEGGFRLNFSEEYLGLAVLADQLIAGKPIEEGLRLSESLRVVERFGIIPEKIDGKTFFKPIFDFSVSDVLKQAAATHWQNLRVPEQTPIDPKIAVRMIAQASSLSDEQEKFLLAALGAGPEADSRFKYFGGSYTPQTFARNRLKFSAANYYILTMPDSGRGLDGILPFTPEYLRAQTIIKKALLYGYSIPISFNFIKGSQSTDGILSCVEKGCWDAELAFPTASWPHANHAVLLVDYRSEGSKFEPVTERTIQKSMETPPVEWVIKNSWGFNINTSANPSLLQRFPLPAFTVMTQEFFEASHRLKPYRFEALVPRKVCQPNLTSEPDSACDLVTSEKTGGMPEESEASVKVNSKVVLEKINRSAFARYPVVYDATARDILESNPILKLVDVPARTDGSEIPQFTLKRQTNIPNQSGGKVTLCGKVEAGPKVKYVAVYYAKDPARPEPVPKAVLASQNSWLTCTTFAPSPGSFQIILQPLGSSFDELGQLRTTVTVAN